jgi:hypothetical protein
MLEESSYGFPDVFRVTFICVTALSAGDVADKRPAQ